MILPALKVSAYQMKRTLKIGGETESKDAAALNIIFGRHPFVKRQYGFSLEGLHHLAENFLGVANHSVWKLSSNHSLQRFGLAIVDIEACAVFHTITLEFHESLKQTRRRHPSAIGLIKNLRHFPANIKTNHVHPKERTH